MPEEIDWFAKARAANERATHLTLVKPEDDDCLVTAADIASNWKPSAEDDALDQALARLGIVGAYQRWSNKSPVPQTTRTEGIKVSCPFPDHPDNNPSCWLNTEKNVGNCGGCNRGFDIIDLYAITRTPFGLGYKPQYFREVRREIALDLGLVVRDIGPKDVVITPEEVGPPPRPDPPDVNSPPDSHAGGDEADAEIIPFEIEPAASKWAPLAIDWRAQLDDSSTFLRAYMDTYSVDWIPDEFNYWCAHVAVAAALGKDLLFDDGEPVKAALYLCTVGPSGSGKTRASNYVRALLRETFHFDPDLGGQRMIHDNGSGESLIADMAAFEATPADPENPKPIPVRGLYFVDELSTFAARSGREGSILKTKLMEFYDKLDEPVNTRSQKGGLIEAIDHYLQVITTTQPRVIDKLLSKDDAYGGFVSRFLFVGGPDKTPEPEVPRTDMLALNLPERLRAIREWAKLIRSKRVGFDDEGRAAWHAFFVEHIRPLKMQVNDPDPVLARIDVLFKRLFLIHAADQHSLAVTKKIVDQVLTLWPYLTQSMKFVGERTTISAETRERTETEDAIMACVYAHKGVITLKQLGVRCTNNLARKHPQGREGVNKAIETLVRAGLITKDLESVAGKTGSKTTVVRAVRGNR